MFNKLKSLFKKPVESQPVVDAPPAVVAEPSVKPKKNPPKASKPRSATRKKQTAKVQLSAKEAATAAGEPWVEIIKVDIDPNNVNSGAFTLDWNDKFVLNLIRSGYKIREDDTESDVVDRWFQTVCRNVALEVYEQVNADPTNRATSDLRQVQRRDLGDGRSEIS